MREEIMKWGMLALAGILIGASAEARSLGQENRGLSPIIFPPVVLARQAGIASVAHLEKAYIEPHKNEQMIRHGIQNERDVMRAVGHTQKSTTSLYYARQQVKPAGAAKSGEPEGGSDAVNGGS